MKNIITLIFLINSICVFSQDTSKIAGFTIFKYENGNVSSKGIIKNGKPDGYWKTFYENGVLKLVLPKMKETQVKTSHKIAVS